MTALLWACMDAREPLLRDRMPLLRPRMPLLRDRVGGRVGAASRASVVVRRTDRLSGSRNPRIGSRLTAPTGAAWSPRGRRLWLNGARTRD